MSEQKEDVIIFEDNTTLGNDLLEQEWSEGYKFSKHKVKPFAKGSLKDWLDGVKNKGTADKKQKVFIGFSTEEMIANDVHKEYLQLRDRYPTLAVSFIYEGSSKDSIQERLGLKTDRQLMNEDKRALAAIGISPNPNLSDAKEIAAEVKKLKEQAVKEGKLKIDKDGTKPTGVAGAVISKDEEENKKG